MFSVTFWSNYEEVVPARMKDLQELIAAVLQKIVDKNQARSAGTPVTAFQSSMRPNASISDYIARHARHLALIEADLIVMLILLNRYLKCKKEQLLTDLNVHRLIATAIQLAKSFHSDKDYTLAFYARVSGLSLAEFRTLQAEFLFSIAFDLDVSTGDYLDYKGELIKNAEKFQHELQKRMPFLIDMTDEENAFLSGKEEKPAVPQLLSGQETRRARKSSRLADKPVSIPNNGRSEAIEEDNARGPCFSSCSI